MGKNRTVGRLREHCLCLPEEWNEPEAGVKTVFGIAGQFLTKNLFLIEQAEDDNGNEEGKNR